MDDQLTEVEYTVFIGNLQKEETKEKLKQRCIDLFKKHLKIDLDSNDIKVKGKKKRARYASIDLQSKTHLNMALNTLGSWKICPQLRFDFFHVVDPNQIIKIDVKRPYVDYKADVKSELKQEKLDGDKNSDTKTKTENRTHKGVRSANPNHGGSEIAPFQKRSALHFKSNENNNGGKENIRYYKEYEKIGNETREKEFKTGGDDHYVTKNFKNHLSTNMCGFLNSSQKGTLFVGVKDNGTVVGIKCNHHTEDLIRIKIDETVKKIKPVIFPQTYQVAFIPIYSRGGDLKDDYKVIEITVERVEKLTQLYEAAGEVYIRRHGSIQGPLKPSDLQEWCKQIHQRELQGALKRQEEENNKNLQLEMHKFKDEKRLLLNEINNLKKQILDLKEERRSRSL